MKRIFLTGISGMLGANIADELLREGYEVTGLLRTKASYKGRQHPSLKLIEGDLFSDLSSELTNTDAVIHAAAETRQSLLHYRDYRRINSDATAMLYLTAVRCGVKRFVYISTANTIGHGSASHPGNETREPREPFTGSLYARSKAEAERYLLSQQSLTEVVILNPTFILGAYGKTTGSARLVMMGLDKRLLFIPPGGKNIVHAGDVARAARQALTRGETGERYLIAGENLSYSDFFRRLNQLSGQHPRILVVSPALLRLAGIAGDLLRRMGFRTGLSYNNMQILCEHNYYSARKSAESLNIKYRSAEEAIQETLVWIRQTKKNRSK